MFIARARRSRMQHPRKHDEVLGPEWRCLLGLMRDHQPDLGKWPLTDVYAAREDGEELDLSFACPPEIRNELEKARVVTFSGGRHLGQEPCGLELFGTEVGKGFDPAMNAKDTAVVVEFFRNIDNWVWSALCFCADSCVAGTEPCVS
jgi:hypothetical protein